MSFINLEFTGIQSPDIMADSVDTKQMLLTLNSKLDWFNSLQNIPFHRSCMSDNSREAGMIRFVKMTIFWEFNSSFSYVGRVFRAVSIVKVHTIRFVSICPLCLGAVQTSRMTQGGK